MSVKSSLDIVIELEMSEVLSYSHSYIIQWDNDGKWVDLGRADSEAEIKQAYLYESKFGNHSDKSHRIIRRLLVEHEVNV